MKLWFLAQKFLRSPLDRRQTSKIELKEDSLLPGRLLQRFDGCFSLVFVASCEVNLGIVLQEGLMDSQVRTPPYLFSMMRTFTVS